MSGEDNRPGATGAMLPGAAAPIVQPAPSGPTPAQREAADKAEMDSYIGESRDVDPDAAGESAVDAPKPKALPQGARSIDVEDEPQRAGGEGEDEPEGDEDREGEDEPDGEGEDEPEGDEDREKEPEPKPRPKLTVKDRIRQLTRQRGDVEAERDAAKRENAELRERIEALERGEKPKPKAAAKSAGDNEGKPDPAQFKYGEVDPEYLDALVEWSTDKRIAKIRAEDEQRETERQRTAAVAELEGLRDTMGEKGVAEFGDDFMTVVMEGAVNNKWPISPVMADLTLRSDVGHKIAHHLATHPKEAREVYGKSPVAQAAYFGRLEAKYLTAAEAEKKPSKQPSGPRVPNPPRHQARGAGGQYTVTEDTTDFAAFEAMANRK